MTERSSAKAKRGVQPKGQRRAGPAAAEQQAEIARLVEELKAARARIVELEQKHAEIVNRIDWIIDSLQNISD